jgi:hypothetical protein
MVIGLYVGLAALVLSTLTQPAWLWYRSRPARAAVRARDEPLDFRRSAPVVDRRRGSLQSIHLPLVRVGLRTANAGAVAALRSQPARALTRFFAQRSQQINLIGGTLLVGIGLFDLWVNRELIAGFLLSWGTAG